MPLRHISYRCQYGIFNAGFSRLVGDGGQNGMSDAEG
jgi:hypothetical protein